MFQSVSEKLDRAFKVLKGQGYITEINVAETLKEVRRALLDADVNYKVAKQFTDTVKEKALGQNVIKSLSPKQLLIKIAHDELCLLMGKTAQEINIQGNPAVILMSGLQGSGKTTHSGKLAHFLKTKKGKNPLLVACDVHRPAAIDQLQTLATAVGAGFYCNRDSKDPVAIAKEAISFAKSKSYNIVILDTAGRLAVDNELMDEIARLQASIQPSETLFVVDGMTGQDAVNTAKAFHDRLQFDGVILTKLDGDTRGGAVISIQSVVNKPIKFVGVGEKMDALDQFHPDRMANRILGMGDVVSLVEKVQSQYTEEEARKLSKKIAKDQFDLNDYLEQLQQMKKMGSLKNIMGMIPGMASNTLPDLDDKQKELKKSEVIISSMTLSERQNPRIINASRKNRIAKGSGTQLNDVNRTLKQFEDLSKVMKKMKDPKAMQQMMGMLKGKF